jgi:hypothetical protein
MTAAHLEEQLLVLLLDDRRSRKDGFWLDRTADRWEQAEARGPCNQTSFLLYLKITNTNFLEYY